MYSSKHHKHASGVSTSTVLETESRIQMRAAVVLLLVCISVKQVESGWEVSPGPLGELDGAPINCNLYQYKDFKFNQLDTAGTFYPRELSYRPHRNNTPEIDRFWRANELLIQGDKIYLVDQLDGGEGDSLVALHIQGFDNVYRTHDYYYRKQNSIDGLFQTVEGVDLWHYLRPLPEKTLVLALQRHRVTQMYATDSFVVWTEQFSDDLRRDGGFEALERIEPSLTSPIILAQDQVSVAPLCGRFAIRFYDESTMTTHTLAVGRGMEDVSYTMPTACREWVVAQKFDYATNRSMVWLHNVATDTSENLVASSQDRNFILPVVFSTEGGDPLGSEQCGACVLVWLETSASVTQTEEATLQVDSPTGGLTDAVIHSLELPCRHFRNSLPPEKWRRTIDEVGYTAEDTEFTLLLDVMPSTDIIFLLVGKPNGNSVERYKVRVVHIHDGVQADVADSESEYPMSFHGVNDQGLLILQHRSNSKVLLLLKLSVVQGRKVTTFCNVMDTSNITTAALFKDIVVWLESDENGDSGTNGYVKLLDLNKDNDELFDSEDRFPMDGEHIWDSDNDEIGDASDLITAKGECINSDSRGKCFSDLATLYTFWACYVLVVCIVCYFGSKWYKKHRDEMKEHQAALINGIKTKGADLKVDVSPGNTTPVRRSSSLGNRTQSSKRISEMIANVQTDDDEKGPDIPRSFSAIKVELTEMACHVVVLSLTIVSLVLATVPFWSTNPPSSRMRQIFMWIDLFITVIFLMDLVVRYAVRDKEAYPTARRFLWHNWSDVLALTTDIPGVTNMGAIRFLVLTRFRHVLRLFRITRILKVFRVVRFYRRFTRQNWFIELMINRPTLFLMVLLFLILMLSASFLKILEQGRQKEFQSLVNTLWFTIVTITTVGYGDMVPLNLFSRFITAGLMIVGIGILGLLTATLLKKLLMGGQGMAELERRKQQNRLQLDLLKSRAAKMTMAYNPMVAVYGEYFNRTFTNDAAVRASHAPHKSSFLNHDKAVTEDAVLPLEIMLARSATKFRASTQDSSAMQDHEIESKHRGAQEREVLLSIFKDSAFPTLSPEYKLHFVLKFFKLDEGKDAVKDFEAFHEDLKLILFNEFSPQNLFLARAIALQEEMDESGNLPDGCKADLKDPIDNVLVRIEETLRRYNVHVRPDFHEIFLELILIAFMHDRVINTQWALGNLRHEEGAVKAYPPVKHGCIKSLGFNTASWNLESQFSRKELVPKLTFVSRRANLSASSAIRQDEKEALKSIVVPKMASVVAKMQRMRRRGESAEQEAQSKGWKILKHHLSPDRIGPTMDNLERERKAQAQEVPGSILTALHPRDSHV